MSVGIRFPASLPVPTRDGYEDAFGEIRSVFTPEIGVTRRRNRMRTVPRFYTLRWVLTDAECAVFDYWFQYTIEGGFREFDIQLLDDDETLTWFTARSAEEFRADRSSDNMEWAIAWRIRVLGETFGTTRDPGTDDLRGQMNSRLHATGRMVIRVSLKGVAHLEVSATARMSPPLMRGLANVGLRVARGRLVPGSGGSGGSGGSSGTDNPLARSWLGLTSMCNVPTPDLANDLSAIKMEWME